LVVRQQQIGRRQQVLSLRLLALLGVLLLSLPAAAAEFPRPGSLEPAVEFWRSIFGTFSRNQVVLHDRRHLGVVYEVLDFRSLAGPDGRLDSPASRRKEQEVKRAEKRIVATLKRLHRYGGKPPEMTRLEARVRDRAGELSGTSKYREAAGRVRSQSGLRECFSAGLVRQRAYRAEMEAIFVARGLPVELAHIPLVESCFDVDAYSKVGAAGVWQFMPRTGRQYLKIDSALDERRDPLRSTEAAAEHLKRDHEALGSWPLAITAYNHGRGGMQKAMRRHGSDFESMVHKYRGRRFGFASRNFYVEFLAAIDVVRDADRHFGTQRELEVPRSREVKLRRSMRLTDAAKHVGVTRDDLIAMNPAFLRRVRYGVDRIPRGYRLRVPRGPRDPALARARRNSGRNVSERDEPRIVVHKVGRGQTLGGIARRYGASVRAIQKMNGVRNPRRIQIGQELIVPLG
jgi:membrane-bound lytic murein transglycosylase D